MASKRKTAPSASIVARAARLPWWLYACLAAIVYLVLHAYATSPSGAITPGRLASTVLPVMLKGLAFGLHYALPILLLLMAVLALLEKSRATVKPADFAPSTGAKRAEAGVAGLPVCPLCAGPMSMRQARRGSKAGNLFWGCRNFPQCRGTLPVEPTP